MFRRSLFGAVATALADTPVVFLAGGRQTGKSTLARELVAQGRLSRYLTFDDPSVEGAARRDPTGFLAGLEGSAVLDEVQRVPDLFPAIKASVDRRREPGRFLLTGSANVLLFPGLSEALVGRMEVLTLHPLSQGEVEGRVEDFVDLLFSPRGLPKGSATLSRKELGALVVRGGFPEAIGRVRPERRATWFDSYIQTLLGREVRDLARIEGLSELPHLLALVAARGGGLLSFADLARDSRLPETTLKRYLTLLEGLFLVRRLPAWGGSRGARLVKSPKIFVSDSGVAAHLVGFDENGIEKEPNRFGSLLETFVVAELVKQIGWSRGRYGVHHFRTHAGREVDVVVENAKGEILGIEVQASATLTGRDVSGLEQLADLAGERFVQGVVLYGGREPIPFGRKIHALPIEALWRFGAGPARKG